MPQPVTILWFRQDLRLDDNPAVEAAAQSGAPVVPVFIWDPEGEGEWPPGGAARWWLHQSLAALDDSLQRRGSRLVLRQGAAAATLLELARQTGARSVHFGRRCEPAARAQERQVAAALPRAGVVAAVHDGALLFGPQDLRTRSGGPYKVFTPFWRACMALPEPDPPVPAPPRLTAPAAWPASVPLADLRLEPVVDWAAGLRGHWKAGEAGAAAALDRFVEAALAGYAQGRDLPAQPGTSELSPYLHHGQVGPRRLWHAVRRSGGDRPFRPGDAGVAFRRQLAWREFAHHLLWHFGHTPTEPLRPDFAGFPWRRDAQALHAWQRGRTGYPIVDAGMRQLWRIGWMHNRARMIAASFLVKDLLLPWQEGSRWFWDTLVDADLANNTLGWQWVAGCGADAAPYFRILNPVLQGRRFDPRGDYVRRWVPELARAPARWIHEPWNAPASVLRAAGVQLGATYPLPIVDHGEARDRALAALGRMARRRARPAAPQR